MLDSADSFSGVRRLSATLLLTALLACSRRDPLPEFPRVVLWAWERPSDLSFLNPKFAGVAFLARTVSWRAGEMHSLPRLQPLRVPPATALMAVVRLESDGEPSPAVERVAQEVLSCLRLTGVRALQVDFDARRSERPWYASLIRTLRREMPPGMPLTITALVSWCEADTWIRDLPVDDAVPMLFQMGPGEKWDGRDFRIGLCRASLGLATNELPAIVPRGRRLYFFRPEGWTAAAYQGIIGEARRRQ